MFCFLKGKISVDPLISYRKRISHLDSEVCQQSGSDNSVRRTSKTKHLTCLWKSPFHKYITLNKTTLNTLLVQVINEKINKF